jgi:hypothetical protein
MKYLVVFNICELKGPNYAWYETCLDNLLKVRSDQYEYEVSVSGCMVSHETKASLLARYKDKIIFNFIDSRLTVNVTFNHTVNKIVEQRGHYDGYVYIDSGVNIDTNLHYLDEIHERYKTEKYGMVQLQTDTDTGFHCFGLHGYFYEHDFIVPVGKACNLHVTCFNDKLLKYYGRLIPDIFVAYCTESVFSFLNAALNLRWIIVKDLILEHKKSVDGASAGFDHIGKKEPWNNLYGGLDMLDIIRDPTAHRLGLGYEEINQIMMHNGHAFTAYGHAKHAGLKDYIKDKLFLHDNMLNYKHIPFQFYNI